ncbi:TPA: hypothetical protein L3545_001376 [Escherichia coli]|nr:hypothetical protein [Escherichia coli]
MAQLPGQLITQPEQSGFFAGPPGGVGLYTGRAARKKAHFYDFIVIIIMCISYCF